MEAKKFWFKDAIIYQLHVRSFADSTGDGIGDFRGLTQKLPYLQEIGVTAVWLLPFYPSPLRDDGYDIGDYYSVNPSYGTLDDFREFLQEAHRRGLKVITELVINHTSDQHAWFQRARRAPQGSIERDFYVWSDTPAKFEDARIIFKDFEISNWAWDPVARAYYWHRFYSHQPDLNFDNPHVRQAVFDVLDFWLEMGVDGLRLDAIPYLFEREGTSCENLPETHAYLADLRKHVDDKFPGRMLLAEANQWPEDAVQYFGKGDECHMAFHFPLMPRLFMSIQMEDRFPVIDILEQTPAIPEQCQWAIFLRNHDELTLEMVTDEERDYMYRLYAEDPRARINLGIRRRLAPLLNNNRRKIELINSLLLSMPGTPIIYYGDEIGMGDNIYLGDRNGVRTPMQWSSERNAGFSRSNPQQLFLPVIIDPEFHYEAINVEVQMRNPSSLFWWTRRILNIRKRHAAFANGSIEFLRPTNAKVMTFLRRGQKEVILVVANLSRFAQAVTLDLVEFAGGRLEELFSGEDFISITDGQVAFTMGPHSFYWLKVHAPKESLAEGVQTVVPLTCAAEWSEELLASLRDDILPSYLLGCRWFGQKQNIMREIRIVTILSAPDVRTRIVVIEAIFAQGGTSTQMMPLIIGKEDEGDAPASPALVARFADGSVLWDALHTPVGRAEIWGLLTSQRILAEGADRAMGHLESHRLASTSASVTSRLLAAEQSNTTLIYDDKYLLKFIRKLDPGIHPEVEMLSALATKAFPHVPLYLGQISASIGDKSSSMGILTNFVPNQGDGWTFLCDAVTRFFERVLTESMTGEQAGFESLLGLNIPRRMEMLGQRTAALHNALASMNDDPSFSEEPMRPLEQRSLYQTMRNLLRRTEGEVSAKLSSLPPSLKGEVDAWMSLTPRVMDAYSVLLQRRIPFTRIRIHGDYHLGQVLNTGDDFVIVDFEGEPRRSLSERRLKRSALVDVAGMLRSFDYAVQSRLLKEKVEDRLRLREAAERWRLTVSKIFIDAYLAEAGEAPYLPQDRADFDLMLKLFLLDKAIYEVGYELNYRPDFLSLPMGAIARILAYQGEPVTASGTFPDCEDK